jgi:hypothetical protein
VATDNWFDTANLEQWGLNSGKTPMTEISLVSSTVQYPHIYSNTKPASNSPILLPFELDGSTLICDVHLRPATMTPPG